MGHIDSVEGAEMSASLLCVENIGRSFGGFKALEGVTASFESTR
jgi:ABC-type branched-subunit amino acid transport system ATPase component